MTCCNKTIIPFAALRTTTVPWVGERPTITIAYLQPDGTFLVQGVFTQIDFQPTEFIIDHGAPSSGYISIVQ